MKLLKNNLPLVTISLMQQFNPIQSKWVVALQMRSVGMLEQSIPFLVAVLYIMVQNFKFSFIICSLKATKTSSLHTFFLTN